jgi:hypothetical protein
MVKVKEETLEKSSLHIIPKCGKKEKELNKIPFEYLDPMGLKGDKAKFITTEE